MTKTINRTKPTTLDFADSFNEVKCKDLLAAILAAFDFQPSDIPGKSGGEPLHTIRQVARMVAIECGYAPKCVAIVTDCGISTAGRAGEAIERRIRWQKAGEKTKRSPYSGPLEPVLLRARAAAAAWKNGGAK